MSAYVKYAAIWMISSVCCFIYLVWMTVSRGENYENLTLAERVMEVLSNPLAVFGMTLASAFAGAVVCLGYIALINYFRDAIDERKKKRLQNKEGADSK